MNELELKVLEHEIDFAEKVLMNSIHYEHSEPLAKLRELELKYKKETGHHYCLRFDIYEDDGVEYKI